MCFAQLCEDRTKACAGMWPNLSICVLGSLRPQWKRKPVHPEKKNTQTSASLWTICGNASVHVDWFHLAYNLHGLVVCSNKSLGYIF